MPDARRGWLLERPAMSADREAFRTSRAPSTSRSERGPVVKTGPLSVMLSGRDVQQNSDRC